MTLAEQIYNLSTLIRDMESGVYKKGENQLVRWDGHGIPGENTQRENLQFCCLGCMSWQMGARYSKHDRLTMPHAGFKELDESYPPHVVIEAFGITARNYPELQQGDSEGMMCIIEMYDMNGNPITQRNTPQEDLLARANDRTGTFDEEILPALRVTLGVLEVRYAVEQVNTLYPDA